MHSGSACQRATAAASPRFVPTERRNRARKNGRDHPSSRQHAECKLVSSTCTDRRCVMCWTCPSSIPGMHSGSACQRVTAAALSRCVPTERRKRAHKSGTDHPSSLQHTECKLVSSNCDNRRCVMCWRRPSSFPRMHFGAASEHVTAAVSPWLVPTKRRNERAKVAEILLPRVNTRSAN